MQRPEATTGTVTVTAYYSDGITNLASGTAQVVDSSGSVVAEKNLENGVCVFEMTAGDYIINIIVDGAIQGNVNVTVINGQVVAQNVVTNKMSHSL